MNPETRKLKQVTIDYESSDPDGCFSRLMGDDVEPRRKFIEERATYAKIDV